MADPQDITLKIRVLNANGQFRGGTVDVEFKHRTLSDHGKQRGLDASREINLAGLRRAPTGDYQITVIPTDVFKPQSQFVNIPARGFAEMTVTLEPLRNPTPKVDPTFTVKGSVHTADGSAFANGLVRAVHQAASESELLSEGPTNDQGNYLLNYSSELIAGPINLRVQALDANKTLLVQSDAIAGAKREEVVNLTLPHVVAPAAPRIVQGNVFFDHGLPAADVVLRLYNRGFGCTETRLAQTTTGKDGSYSFAYDPGGNPAILEVRAIDPQGHEVSLSNPKFNAGTKEVLNLIVPAGVQPLSPEYQRLIADLKKHTGTAKLADSRENEKCQDITWLRNATGWDARLIVLAAVAQRLSTETGISDDALYGLFRTGFPLSKQELAGLPARLVTEALRKANSAGILNLSDAQIAAARTAFERFRHEHRLSTKVPGGSSSPRELLAISGLSDNEKKIFADLYAEHHSESGDLWKQARERGISSKKVEGLRVQGKLAYLTLNNAALTKSLQSEIDAPDKVSKLVDAELYKPEEWKSRMLTIAGNDSAALDKLIPPAYVGETAAARLEGYAEDLARKVRLSFPTKIVMRRIAQSEIQLGQHQAVKDSVTTFLGNATGLGYELGRVPFDSFVSQNREALFKGISPTNERATAEAVKTLHRLYQTTTSDESLKVVLDLGFNSAQEIAAYPRGLFMDRFGAKFRSAREAELVYGKAQQITVVTYTFFSIAKQLDTAPPMYAVSPPSDVIADTKNELIKHYPTMEGLFGSLDFCECEHCHSVLSPAAYLVDLFQFLDPDPLLWSGFLEKWRSMHEGAAYPFNNPADQDSWLADWRVRHPGQPDPNTEKKPFDVLSERRPDLPNLQLTCDNTNTVLPYIDVVNEILEYYVAVGHLDAAAAHDTGTATSPELLAEPQNILPEAYETLRSANYPLNLPFDLWLETVRRFCDYFESPLWRVLEVFRRTDQIFPPDPQTEPYYRVATSAERLGISPAEYAIFTQPNPLAAWHELYGYASGAEALGALKSAKTLSRRLGVTYKELLALVQTNFLNPRLAALVTLKKLGFTAADVFRFKEHPAYEPLSTGERAAFVARLAELSTAFASSHFNATAWLNSTWDAGGFNQILLLVDPNTGCNFDATTLRYSEGADAEALDFLKLNLFVRLWRKLGWTIEEADRALAVFIPVTSAAGINQLGASDTDRAANLGPAFKTALLYLSSLITLEAQIEAPNNSRIKLLTFWSNLQTTGKQALYAQLFLKQSVLKNDAVFDDPLGRYLADDPAAPNFIKDHLPALQGALTLTADEIVRILADAGQNISDARLTLQNVSLLYRSKLLAKALKLSIEELIPLAALTGLTPFKPLKADPVIQPEDDFLATQTLRFVEVAGKVKQSGLKIQDLDYLLRHHFDPVGKYRENSAARLQLAKNLAAGLGNIQAEQSVPEVLGEDQLKQRLALVLSPDLLAGFMAAISSTMQSEVHQEVPPAQSLDPKPLAGDPDVLVTYDSARTTQRLTYRGLLSNARKAQLATGGPPLLATLLNKVQAAAFQSFEARLEAVVESLMSTAEFHAIQQGVVPANMLEPRALAIWPEIRVTYDAARTTQRLTYRGLLLNTEKNGIIAKMTALGTMNIPLLTNLLNAVQSQSVAEAGALIQSSVAVLLDNTVFSASADNVLLANKLEPASFERDPGVSVAYDDARPWNAATTYLQNDVVSFNGSNWLANRQNQNVQPVVGLNWSAGQRRTQSFSFRGLLSSATKTRLMNRVSTPTAVLKGLLDNTQAQGKEFLSSLRVGRLAATDFNLLFDFESLAQVNDRGEDNRVVLNRAFQPFIMRRLHQQLVVQTLASDLNADVALTEALLTWPTLLTDPEQRDKPLLDAFTGLAAPGVNAVFFASTDRSGAVLQDGVMTSASKTGGPAAANSAHFEGYLEVPVAGAYRFFARLGKSNAVAEFHLGESPDPLVRAKAEIDGDEHSNFAELQPGILYRFTLDADNLNGGDISMLIQGGGLLKGSLSQLRLYPAASIERLRRARLLLAKVLQLIQALGLNEKEVRYLLTHSRDFAGADLSNLATREDLDPTQGAALFAQFLSIAEYSFLKAEVAGGGDDLITIFVNARRTYPNGLNVDQVKAKQLDDVCQLFADLTRQPFETVKATAGHLAFAAESSISPSEMRVEVSAFVSGTGLRRLWESLQVVEKLGLPADVIVGLTEIINDGLPSTQRMAIARNMRNAVKAHYGQDKWERVAQPIFDSLRKSQRDALVAFAMHRNGFARIEQLFEYFLIDAGMEPVVQTSRLRLAISSVQTFIQRCLLNLEPEVRPAAINSQHWQWMKRYRVWEANRKMFLFPENWLEPEFRDDKTDLFQNLESELMQGDVSNDLVEDAFFKYLKKLEELARLEIVTVYCEEKPNDLASNTLHVIGRTYGQPAKYFYRRYAHQMWTPWEAVGVDVEGDHVAAVMWRNRLHLFWFTFIEKAKENTSAVNNAPETGLAGLNFRQLLKGFSKLKPHKEVELRLSWSEYFQGQWIPGKSSGLGTLTIDVPDDFDRKAAFIYVEKEFVGGEEGAVQIHLLGEIAVSFRIVSKNSAPEGEHDSDIQNFVNSSSFRRPFSFMGWEPTSVAGSGALYATFDERIETEDGKDPVVTSATKPILRQGNQYSLVRCSNLLDFYDNDIRPLVSPFFYRDNLNTFYVEPNLTETTLERWESFAIPGFTSIPDDTTRITLPPLDITYQVRDFGIPNPIDPIARFGIRDDGDWVTNPGTIFRFDDRLVDERGGFSVPGNPGDFAGGRQFSNLNLTRNSISAIGRTGRIPTLTKTFDTQN